MGFSSLMEDLAQRGLLQSTLVLWYGEFGRTPKIDWAPPWNGGRHHYPLCYSAVVGGGGFRGGTVVGSSDAKGELPKDRPVYPWDLTSSIYKLLGINPTDRLPHPQGLRGVCDPTVQRRPPHRRPAHGNHVVRCANRGSQTYENSIFRCVLHWNDFRFAILKSRASARELPSH